MDKQIFGASVIIPRVCASAYHYYFLYTACTGGRLAPLWYDGDSSDEEGVPEEERYSYPGASCVILWLSGFAPLFSGCI